MIPRPASGSGAGKPARNEAIDFCRGLGLWMLFIDHFEPNFWSHFTLAHFGFSDFAEIFIFLSGFINAGMYRRALETGGLALAARKLGARMVRLYAAHIASLVASLALLAAFETGGLLLDEPELYVWMDAPARYALRMLALMYAPKWFGLLPLYIILAPFMLLAVISMRRWPVVTLAASGAIWWIAQYDAFDLPITAAPGAWHLRPLAWQFLFVIGALAETYWERVRRVAQSPIIQTGAATVVLVCFALKTAAAIGSIRSRIFAPTPVLIPLLVRDAGKSSLAPYRLVHFLSLAVLAIAIPWNRRRALEFGVVRLAIGVGRDSLPIFCVTLVLTVGGSLLLENYAAGKLLQLVFSALGVAVMCAIAYARGKVPARG